MNPTNKLLINDGNRIELRGKFWMIPTEGVKQAGDWVKGFKIVGYLEDKNFLFQRVWEKDPKLLKEITNEKLREYVGEIYTDNTCFELEY